MQDLITCDHDGNFQCELESLFHGDGLAWSFVAQPAMEARNAAAETMAAFNMSLSCGPDSFFRLDAYSAGAVPAGSAGSTVDQVLSGSYSSISRAIFSVSSPRSFSKRMPSRLIMNVMIPDAPYSAG